VKSNKKVFTKVVDSLEKAEIFAGVFVKSNFSKNMIDFYNEL